MTCRRRLVRAVHRFTLRLALAGLLALCGGLTGLPVLAFEPPPGNKNFTSPSSVPNYFSNEAEPFGRGSRTAVAGADRFNTPPVAASGGPAATAQPTRSAAASAGRGWYHVKPARGGAGRIKSASWRAGLGHVHKAYARRARGGSVHKRLFARAASRHVVATAHPAAAGRSRHALGVTSRIRHASR
jgi:hypothetical protein